MKRLGFIIQMANHQTKTKPQTTNTDDTQIPRPDLRIAKEKQQRSKTRKGVKAQTKNILREKQVLQFKHTSIFLQMYIFRVWLANILRLVLVNPNPNGQAARQGSKPKEMNQGDMIHQILNRMRSTVVQKANSKSCFFCLLWFGRLCTMARSLAVKQKARPKDQRVQ